jgi:hypothetical protein
MLMYSLLIILYLVPYSAFLRCWCLVEIAAAAMRPNMPRVMKCGKYILGRDGSVTFESNSAILLKLAHLIDINDADATVASDKSKILSDI